MERVSATLEPVSLIMIDRFTERYVQFPLRFSQKMSLRTNQSVFWTTYLQLANDGCIREIGIDVTSLKCPTQPHKCNFLVIWNIYLPYPLIILSIIIRGFYHSSLVHRSRLQSGVFKCCISSSNIWFNQKTGRRTAVAPH